MVDSEATKHSERVQTTKKTSIKAIKEGEDHRNDPGTSFECFRQQLKLERKVAKFSYILTAMISNVILNLKACNLQNVLFTI